MFLQDGHTCTIYSQTVRLVHLMKFSLKLILPFLEAEVGISALRLDNTLYIRVSCAHTELERCWLACCPAVKSLCVIDATALRCGQDVERPENPATTKRFI